MVDFDGSASTESENEGLPLTQLPATTASTSALTVLPTVTADSRTATLPGNKCVIYVFYISQIFIFSSFQNVFLLMFTKFICPWQSA